MGYTLERLMNMLRQHPTHPDYHRAAKFIYYQHHKKIKNWLIKRFHLSREEAAEIYCAAITALIINIRKDDAIQKKNLEAYLTGIARFKALAFLRKQQHQQQMSDELAPSSEPIENPDDNLLSTTCKQLYGRLKNRLKDPCHTMLLQKAQGYSLKELAVAFGYTGNNLDIRVGMKLTSCRKKLKKIIDNDPSLKHQIDELFK